MADTGAAKRPGLPALQSDNAALNRWASAVAEHVELSAGARGNPLERSITKREFDAITGAVQYLSSEKREVRPGDTVIDLGGGLTATIAIDRFAESIKATQLYKDLMRSLDDPNRFNTLPELVRTALLTSLSEQAAKLGADISRVETKLQNSVRSLAMVVEQVTAAVEGSTAGVRELTFASANNNQAQAGKFTQIEAGLGATFANGTAIKAKLEQSLTVTADRVNGANATYMMKVKAGDSQAAFGISANAPINGQPNSTFLIAADQFALIDPSTYQAGVINTIDTTRIPFGVDGNGVYINSNVYIKGGVKIDAGGKTLSSLRGSVVGYGVLLSALWSDNTARYVVWTRLGNNVNTNPPDNNHLVIGDQITLMYPDTTNPTFTQTKMWIGSGWDEPGFVLNGNMLVNGTVAARHINTNGLTIKDLNGNVILGAGVNLSIGRITGLGSLASQSSVSSGQVTGLGSLATQNSVSTGQVTGLGALAGQNQVFLDGDQVQLYNGTQYVPLKTADFVNKLSKIGSGNINAFIDGLAITDAYIGNASISSAKIQDLAVGTLKIGENSVTLPFYKSFGETLYETLRTSDSQYLEAKSKIIVIGTVATTHSGFKGAQLTVGVGVVGVGLTNLGTVNFSFENFGNGVATGAFTTTQAGYHFVYAIPTGESGGIASSVSITAMGAQR